MLRPLRIAAIALALYTFCCAPASAAPPTPDPRPPLHQRIDALVESAAIGPLAPTCSDADFVRRIYLDLTGVVPTAEQSRQFVAEPAPDKRQKLIDELLASPDFLRHMTITLDCMLMERKPEKVIKQPEWEAYLYTSLANDKPLDQLFRELIAADGSDETSRPAARFVIDRDAEPNLLTRDIGRIAFGMDLQCCQCHDHPLIDDYYQDDYYGLFAFVHRTTLFTDTKTRLISLTEKADGEAAFKSVFTGASSDKALPRLPKGAVLFLEPTFAKGEEYSVKPDKTVRGVPKFSRRATLAGMIPASREFSRNLANRLWAQMLGRGIVHPVDFHYAANPPSNPQLLTLLADELAYRSPHAPREVPSVSHNTAFQLRPFLREIALSRTYQRSCDPPKPDTLNYSDIAARLNDLTNQKQARQAELQPLKDALADSKTAFKTAREQDAKSAAEFPPLETALAEARKTKDTAATDLQSADLALAKLRAQSRSIADASAKLAEVTVGFGEDSKKLADAAAKVAALASEFNAAVDKATQVLADRAANENATVQRLAHAEQALATAKAARPAPENLRQLEQAQLTAEHRLSEANYAIAAIGAQMARAQALLDYAALAKADPVKAEAAWSNIIEQWTIAGQIAALKPLTPEQFAASALQATDMLAPELASAQARLNKSPEAVRAVEQVAGKLKAQFVVGGIRQLVEQGLHASDAAASAAAQAEKQRQQSMLLQRELLTQLRPTFNEFVRQYGGQPGEEFQATVGQALFFGNGNAIDAWLKPSGNSLVARLATLDDMQKIADEMSWSIFSRPATETEKQTTIAYLKDRTDKPAAIAEIAWAFLSSTEFRFNH